MPVILDGTLGIDAAGLSIDGLDATVKAGTWTPIITAPTNPSSITYGVQIGRWFRIGRTVFAQVAIQTSARSGGSGSLQVTLPFRAVGGSNFPHPCFTSGIPWPASRTSIHALPQDAESYFNITGSGSNQSGAALNVTDIPSAAAALIRATLVYETDEP